MEWQYDISSAHSILKAQTNNSKLDYDHKLL